METLLQPVAPLAHVWAKAPTQFAAAYPLVAHGLDAAAVATHLWNSYVTDALKVRICDLLDVDDDTARRILTLAAAAHDIGKANPWFQYQEATDPVWAAAFRDRIGLPGCEGSARLRLRQSTGHPLRRHEVFSFRAVTGDWPEDHNRISSRCWLGALVGGHHGYWKHPPEEGWVNAEPMLDGWETLLTANLRLAEAAAGITTGKVEQIIDDARAANGSLIAVPFICLSGLLTIADYLASDTVAVAGGHTLLDAGFDPHTPDGAAAWVERRFRDLAGHVEVSLGAPPSGDAAALTGAVLGRHTPRPLQVEAQNLGDDRGLWICTYPTGDGKTEAAMLRHANVATEGFIFALPTRATTDKMEDRLTEWVAATGSSLTKSHQFAAATSCERQPADSDGTWYTKSIRKLVAPNVVATCDQVLTGALAARHITLRLFALANHHIIVDEVHTFDTYQLELLAELLTWWGATRTRVTLLSATLARTQLDALVRAYRRGGDRKAATSEIIPPVPFPGTLFVPADPALPLVAREPVGTVRAVAPATLTLVRVDDRDDRVTRHQQWAVGAARRHPAAFLGVFTNTVRDCQEVADWLAGGPVSDTHDVLCLHAQMTERHRRAAETALLDRAGSAAIANWTVGARPLAVVGSPVIQASLNFSVDIGSTDLCPAADLLQRLGRRLRFQNDPGRAARIGDTAPPFQVVATTDPGTSTVARRGARPYHRSRLQRTFEWLAGNLGPTGGLLDVMAASQRLVDESFDPVSDTETFDEEAVDRILRLAAAASSKAALSRFIGPDLRGLAWRDLVEIADRAVTDEDLMWTRYIDMPSRSVLLFDSAAPPSGPAGLLRPPPPIHRITNATLKQAATLLEHATKMPIGFGDALDEAIRRTIGTEPDRWNPNARMLTSLPPVDIRHLDGATYSPLTGLTMKKADL